MAVQKNKRYIINNNFYLKKLNLKNVSTYSILGIISTEMHKYFYTTEKKLREKWYFKRRRGIFNNNFFLIKRYKL